MSACICGVHAQLTGVGLVDRWANVFQACLAHVSIPLFSRFPLPVDSAEVVGKLLSIERGELKAVEAIAPQRILRSPFHNCIRFPP